MGNLKTIRLKKLNNLGGLTTVEGRTYYIEENNTFYKDIDSIRTAIGNLYITEGNEEIIEEETRDLSSMSNSLLINLSEDNGVETTSLFVIDEEGKKHSVKLGPDRYGRVRMSKDKAGWAKVAEVKKPFSQEEHISAIFIISGENNSSTLGETYLGIAEWNILSNADSTSFKWLAAYGYSKNNFNIRYDSGTDMISLWVYPTVGNMNLLLLSENTNGVESRKIRMFTVDKKEIRTGKSLKNSEYLNLQGMVSEDRTIADLPLSKNISVEDLKDKLNLDEKLDKSLAGLEVLRERGKNDNLTATKFNSNVQAIYLKNKVKKGDRLLIEVSPYADASLDKEVIGITINRADSDKMISPDIGAIIGMPSKFYGSTFSSFSFAVNAHKGAPVLYFGSARRLDGTLNNDSTMSWKSSDFTLHVGQIWKLND